MNDAIHSRLNGIFRQIGASKISFLHTDRTIANPPIYLLVCNMMLREIMTFLFMRNLTLVLPLLCVLNLHS